MSKFSQFRFYSSEDPLLVSRVVCVEEKHLLYIFPLGWKEIHVNIWTLAIDRSDAWNNYLPMIAAKRIQSIESNGISSWKIAASRRFDPLKAEDLRNLRSLILLRFDISLPPTHTSASLIEAYLKTLPLSKRLSYREIDKLHFDEDLGCTKWEYEALYSLKRRMGGII